MRIAVLGGTGFVGQALVRALAMEGHTIHLFVRPGSETRVLSLRSLKTITGDITRMEDIRRSLDGVDGIIYSIGLIREFHRKNVFFEQLHYRSVVDTIQEAQRRSIRRFILISANGVSPDGTPYQRTKHAGEQALRNSGLDWTILRPSLIFGPPRGADELASQLLRQIVRPLVPAPAFFTGFSVQKAGKFELSPVHVDDVAQVVCQVLKRGDRYREKTLVLGGPETLTWNEIIRRIGRATGKQKWLIPVPTWGLRPVLALLDQFSWFPVTRDQLTMLLAGNVAESTELFRELEIQPKRFHEENLRYLLEG